MAYRPSLRRWARSVGRLFRASGGASKRTKRFTSALGEFVLDTLLLPFAIAEYLRERKKKKRYDYEPIEIPLDDTPYSSYNDEKTPKNAHTGAKNTKKSTTADHKYDSYAYAEAQSDGEAENGEEIPVLEAKSIHINIASPRKKDDNKSQ